MVIQINVTDKHAKALGQPKIVCGNSGYSIKFTFDAGWGAETIKTARFVYMARGDVAYTDVVFTGDTVSVPVLSNVREVRVGVFEGDLHTTTPAVIPCERSIRCGTGAPADPTPSQYDQIMALLNNPAGANPLTAKVGQTVIVKSVDENGKPTEWEAADYQPKTHWSETVYGEVLPLTKFVANGTKNTQLPTTVLELGKTYTVVYDGTPYTCEAKAVESGGVIGVGIGNDRFFGGEQTNEPFALAYDSLANVTGIIPLTDIDSVHSVQITGEKTVYHKIPREYLYSKRIEFTLGSEDTPGYWYAHTNTDIRDIINDAENGVFQYATITFPMQMDERTADMHLTMPLASHETFTRDDGITVYKARFECETELDKRYVFAIAIEAWPEVGVIISGLTKKIADSIKVDTAAVGQTIVVKSVDENGKPKEWEAVDKANEVNHGRLLAEVNFTEESTGVTITDINADVIELAVLIEAATSTPPKFTINEHTVNIVGGGWAGGSHIFVKIDKGNGVARIKATATNKGRSNYEIPWDKNEIVESIGIGNLGFASGDFVRVYEGLLAPQLKENWVWND